MTHNSWSQSSVTPNLLNKHVYPHNSPSYLTKVITLSICKLGIHLANELWRFWTQIFSWTSLVTNITCTTICSTFQNVKTQAHSQYKISVEEFKIHFEGNCHKIIFEIHIIDIFILPLKNTFLSMPQWRIVWADCGCYNSLMTEWLYLKISALYRILTQHCCQHWETRLDFVTSYSLGQVELGTMYVKISAN